MTHSNPASDPIDSRGPGPGSSESIASREARLAALDGYDILDTPAEQGFDDIVELAKLICGTPIALVSFVAADRQWFKAKSGLAACETPLSQSVCQHGLAQPGLLVIPDLTQDARTRDNPLVTGEPLIRFYAGTRLSTPDGVALGMLCVIDTQAWPQGLSSDQGDALDRLGRQVMAQMELRRSIAMLGEAHRDTARSEARLRESNADLERRVLERTQQSDRTWQVSPDLLSVISLVDGRFARVNPAWTAKLGWHATTLEGTPYADYVHPDDLAASIAAFERVQRGQPVLNFVNRYRCVSGDYRWLAWVAVPEGSLLYSSARDITDERAQADVLAQRTAERDRMWINSPDLLVELDSDGVLHRANPAWRAILGLDESSLVGTRIDQLIHPDDVALTALALDNATKGPLTVVENRYRHKDGTYRWISWVKATDRDRIYATGRHVTQERERQAELHAAQEALRQSQKMEAVGQLTGGLAHDFNNLLTGITGSLELLQLRIEQGRVGEVERYVKAAQGAAKRAAALTHRLLAFSRRQTLAPKPTDVKHLVAGMEEMIRRTVGPEIEIGVVHAVGLWPCLIDPGQLENAVLNLCINARDAMPEGGRITIETANRWIDARTAHQRGLEPGQYISLCVSDTGAGMPPDVVAKAFEPFFTTKPLGMGTGLGLSMIYGFAKQSGGAVSIYSEVGAGSMICIYLPRYLDGFVTIEASDDSEAPARAIAGETVLIVDDEPTVRMFVAEVLNDLGYTAIEAAEGSAALRLLTSDARIDLLVTDVGLPGGLNGREVADAARQVRPDLKVLFITGYAENAVLSHGHLEPGMHVLTKPFSMESMAARIRELIGG